MHYPLTYVDPYDILSIVKLFWNSFEIIKGHKGVEIKFIKMLQVSWKSMGIIITTFWTC